MDLDEAMGPRSIRAGWRATLAAPVIFGGAALVVVAVGRWRELRPARRDPLVGVRSLRG